ncbi:RNA-directed DNA polymerase from mobile element jockey [Trichonephila clavipes]|nr:RNA-directed DNA polymerase from mobile element jockey [Trichonephila clavipes]
MEALATPSSTDSAILIPSLNATASGVTDATKPAVRGSVGKYATRTVNSLQLNINGTQKKFAELKDRVSGAGGGIAFLVKTPEIIYIEILPTPNTSSSTEAQAINILCYPIILLRWSKHVSKTNGTASPLDISAISYASANNAHWKVLDATISDHFPVLTTLPIVQEPTTQEKRSWDFRKVNWDGFTQELENLCSDLPKHNDAEKLLHLLSSCIQKAAKHHIPRGKRRNNWIPFWKDHNIKDLIQVRDSIGQELQRNNRKELKRNFIEVSHREKELILESKKEQWAELCSKLDPRKGTPQYWNLLKPHEKTVAVFLDLSSAFDRVWRQKLVDIIHSSGVKDNALLWINDFLRGRKFSVKFNGVRSKSHRLWSGVPQGGVLSPLLFLLYMNTIHSPIHPDTKIACYANDIALWHTHRDIAVSEKALNKTLKGIAAWAKDLKLTINADKINYCIFSTDKRHRGTFNADIKIEDYNIKRVTSPTYLGVTVDSELRFTKHIEQTTIKALRKLNILGKLCGTTWGSRPRTLKNAYSIIRPVLEYAAPILSPASVSSKQKLGSIQHRASKIIIGAVSSTNNEKAEREWGLPPL